MILEELSEKHENAFRAMLEDYRSRDPEGLANLFGEIAKLSPAKLKKHLKDLEKEKQDWRPKAGKTSVTHYALLGPDGEIRATTELRFPMDENAERDGGNIRFAVPPSLRGRGFASYGVALTLFEAHRAGLSRVLLTCPESDKAARRVAEKNRGELLDVVDSPLRPGTRIARYWIRFR